MELRKDNINYYLSMQISVWIKKKIELNSTR